MEPLEFIDKFNSDVGDYIRSKGLPLSLLIAQTALESGWGKKVTGTNNYFGIKWKYGRYTECLTKERYAVDITLNDARWKALGNNWYEGPALFQNFDSLQEGVEFWVTKMKTQDEYKDIWSASEDYWERVKLVCSKYATDDEYLDKIERIITKYGLQRYDTPNTEA